MTLRCWTVWAMISLVLLSACGPRQDVQTDQGTEPIMNSVSSSLPAGSSDITDPTEPSDPTVPTKPIENPSAPVETLPIVPIDPPMPTVPDPDKPDEKELTIQNTGKRRVTYTVKISSVHYYTAPTQLPNYPELACYDEEWFRDHALVVVFETVSSGSLTVDIQKINVQNGAASVELTHNDQGGIGTADMTTWLLWAEVERGLHYTWTVMNPAMDSDISST
jgi:hypothetical protein